jgi:hypothetical protein
MKPLGPNLGPWAIYYSIFLTVEIVIGRQFQFVLLIFYRVLISKPTTELHDQGVLEYTEKSFFLFNSSYQARESTSLAFS